MAWRQNESIRAPLCFSERPPSFLAILMAGPPPVRLAAWWVWGPWVSGDLVFPPGRKDGSDGGRGGRVATRFSPLHPTNWRRLRRDPCLSHPNAHTPRFPATTPCALQEILRSLIGGTAGFGAFYLQIPIKPILNTHPLPPPAAALLIEIKIQGLSRNAPIKPRRRGSSFGVLSLN